MCGTKVDIQSAAAEIRRGIKKKIEDRKKPQDKNIMSASATQGGHNKVSEITNHEISSTGRIIYAIFCCLHTTVGFYPRDAMLTRH